MSIVVFEAVENDKATDLYEAEKVCAKVGPYSGGCVAFYLTFALK